MLKVNRQCQANFGIDFDTCYCCNISLFYSSLKLYWRTSYSNKNLKHIVWLSCIFCRLRRAYSLPLLKIANLSQRFLCWILCDASHNIFCVRTLIFFWWLLCNSDMNFRGRTRMRQHLQQWLLLKACWIEIVFKQLSFVKSGNFCELLICELLLGVQQRAMKVIRGLEHLS